jgi:uncharacterized ParB-like nuclease family protein
MVDMGDDGEIADMGEVCHGPDMSGFSGLVKMAPPPGRSIRGSGRAIGRKTVLAKAAGAVQADRMLKRHHFEIDKIRVPVKRLKTLEADKVLALAEDILENGQTTPIRVRADAKGFILIEGLHRLEAMRALGEETIEGYLVRARLH